MLLTLLFPIVAGAIGHVRLTGYNKNYTQAINPVDYEFGGLDLSQPIEGMVTNRLRLRAEATLSSHVSVELAYDISPWVQEAGGDPEWSLAHNLQEREYRAVDFADRLYPDDDEAAGSFQIYQNLDRALVTVNTSLADTYVGRQAVAWGSARVINPTDVLAPFSFDALDVEDRRGVDAVRIRIPLGLMGELDGGLVFGDDAHFRNNAFFLRAKTYHARTDISAIVTGFRRHLMLGIDITRPIGGAGCWLEAAHVLVGALEDGYRRNDLDYFRITTGFDYVLRDGTYLFCEYHYNGAGYDADRLQVSDLLSPAYLDGSVFLTGKHYLCPGITHPVTPLITVSGQMLVNLSDPSLFLAPGAEYNIAENIYLSAGANIGLGARGEIVSSGGLDVDLRVNSEFGNYADLYYASFRVYF